MNLDLQSLIKKLNPTCRQGLEKAAELCVSQTNYNVEIEHLLLSLMDIPDTDIQKMLRHYGIEGGDVRGELTRSIDRLKRGNNRTPALSGHILELIRQSWLLCSLQLNIQTVCSGAVFLSVLDDNSLRGMILESAPSLKRIPRESLKRDIGEFIGMTGEDTGSAVPPAENAVRSGNQPAGTDSKTPFLDQYTVDFVQRVKDGLVDPIQGRNAEIRQIIDILTRRRQNNPILTGDAGVGKTAIVEGFAIRVAKGEVPPPLRNISIRNLDLGLLQAGAGVKGEFEKRLKTVIDEVKRSPIPIILFIDEAHTLIGAGGQQGSGDAANLLKPALARGELRTIAATTWSEYKKYFEKDTALARRFQVVKVDEPEEREAVEMLRGLIFSLEAHHKVIILDEAVRDAVRLTKRYITGRKLPDKAISVLDTACARVAVAQNSIPPEIENIRYRLIQARLELSILERERLSGSENSGRLEEIRADIAALEKSGEKLEARWKDELERVEHIVKLRREIEKTLSATDNAETDVDAVRTELAECKTALADIQGKEPMVDICVDASVIASVISGWTGIPVGKMLTDEIKTILALREKMEERVIGQSHALETICKRIRTFRANLDDPGKPAGVFLLVGSSGIGKTETALTLAELLYGGDRNMVTLNMSEYQEAHTVSGLKGSPPGYVGFGQGGILTEAVRQKPYCCVLLDEVEKAHPDVLELFYQVFDKGALEDAEGLRVDFKNTVILLTSNVGTDTILKACRDFDNLPDSDSLLDMVRPELMQHFKPAFLGRLIIVPYYPLGEEIIRKIVRLKLDKIRQRFLDNHRVEFTYSDELVAAIAERCNEVDTGARTVDHLLTQTLLPELSGEILHRMAESMECVSIHVDLGPSGGWVYLIDPPLPDESGNSDSP